MILKESIKTAIQKTKSSYDAYEWILRNQTTVEESSEDYKSNFSTAQQVFSAVDILLRCFVIEKAIPVYRVTKTGFKPIRITEQTDDQEFKTSELCRGILAYNQAFPEKQWLTDVDFSCFTEDNKKIRNMDEHLGITGVLHDLYRVYFNLNKIYRALDMTDYILVLDTRKNTFDYARFDGCMDGMEEDDRRFILLADSMHNVEKKHLEAFLQIPWSVILDFDGASEFGGLQSVFQSTDYSGRHYTPYLYSSFTINSDIKFTRAHITLCEDDLRKRFVAKKQDDDDNVRIPAIINNIRDSIHSKATIVVTGIQTERVSDLCKQIKRMFIETDIIYLTDQKNIPLVEKTEDEDWTESGNIANVNSFKNSIFEVMQSIYDNRRNFLEKMYDDVIAAEKSYIFHTLDKNKLTVRDMDLLHRKEQYFEFLHMNTGNDKTKCNEWNFFHGDIVNWETIRYGYVESLIDINELKSFEEEIKREQSGSCFTIYHLPGFGGTTLGRLIAWDLHTDMPVVRLKEYDTIQKLAGDIGDIYIHLFSKHKFLILIDENDFSLKQMQELEKMVFDSEYTIKALFVKRIANDSEAKKKQKKKDYQKNEIIFSVLESKPKDKLMEKCRHLLQEKGQESLYDQRVMHMDKTLDERQKCALIINLYLLEENFNLKNYVKKFLCRLENDSDGDKYRKIFSFIAMSEYYSNLSLPAAYIINYVDRSKGLRVRTLEMKLNDYDGLLLKTRIQETGDIYYGIKHYLIAKEMLSQILQTDSGENWKGMLPELVKEFIDFLYQLVRGMDKIDDLMKNIISWLFTDKTKSRWYYENDDEYESSFTSLLTAMSAHRRIEVIEYLATKFGDFIETTIPRGKHRGEYKILAHIYAQRARIRSKSQRLDDNEEKQDSELKKYMQETITVINEEDICEYVLEHMLGMCYLERAKRIGEKGEWTQDMYDELLSNIDKAIERFNYTIWYGSPDYGVQCKIDATTTAISAIIRQNSIKEYERISKLCQIPAAKKYVDIGIKAIQDIDEYALSIKASTLAEKRKEEFEQTCFPNKSSEFLQRLNNLNSNLRSDDYEGHYMVSSMTVYAYEKKHYSEEYRRSSLIRKALNGDPTAKGDAERVFSHLDKIVKMDQEHPVSFTTYNLWFEYAKYMEIPLAKAFDQAYNWKRAENMRESNGMQKNNLLRPCYYLFVIQLLRYCAGENITDSDLLERKQDLSKQISASRKNDVVQDWYANRKGLGHLYSREWIDVKNVDGRNDIAEVRGRVVYVDSEKNNYGYLRVTEPNAMSRWAKAPKGIPYNTDSDVYFAERQTNIISEKDIGKEKKFKFGFSYNKMIASMNSLEKGNIIKTIVEEIAPQEKTSVKNEIPFKKEKDRISGTVALGTQIECSNLHVQKGAVIGTICYAGNVYDARIPKHYLIPDVHKRKLPKQTRGIIIGLPRQGDSKYIVQPINEEDIAWQIPDSLPFILAGTDVSFIPTKKKPNAFAGTVNGYPATINKSFLDKDFYNILMHAIQTKESVSVKMLEINTQGTGYTLFI